MHGRIAQSHRRTLDFQNGGSRSTIRATSAVSLVILLNKQEAKQILRKRDASSGLEEKEEKNLSLRTHHP
ncbi:hypothetical protein TNCV_4402131 [Trichonephila clavipes]|nr:hypothetical protein TNCV_4402131 [Trichonephila clavipes]